MAKTTQRRPKPAPSLTELLAMEDALNSWTEMAGRAYGRYAGINDAIHAAPEKSAPIVHIASDYRQEMAMAAIIRSFAVLDGDAIWSLQSAYRFIKEPKNHSALIAQHVDECAMLGTQGATREASEAIEAFLRAYALIDWKDFGQLQKFRNEAIAHVVQWKQMRTLLTYGKLESLVRISCQLSGQLSLLSTGKNRWTESYLDEERDKAKEFWLAVFEADVKEHIDF